MHSEVIRHSFNQLVFLPWHRLAFALQKLLFSKGRKTWITLSSDKKMKAKLQMTAADNQPHNHIISTFEWVRLGRGREGRASWLPPHNLIRSLFTHSALDGRWRECSRASRRRGRIEKRGKEGTSVWRIEKQMNEPWVDQHVAVGVHRGCACEC